MSQTFRAGGHRTGPPVIMGILNATPDSFSDGGRWESCAVGHAFDMIDAGASIIDVGGESTRPGAVPVPADVEIARISDIIGELAGSTDVPISVDTMKPEVAAAALDLGALIVNDVNGLLAPGMLEVCAEHDAAVVIMQAEGGVFDKADGIAGDAVSMVSSFLKSRADAALDAGIRRDGIILDPGLGFGKTPEQNHQLLVSSDDISNGYPVLIGASRKRFLAHSYPGMDPDAATAAAMVEAVRCGADIIRVHDVGATVGALRSEGLLRL